MKEAANWRARALAPIDDDGNRQAGEPTPDGRENGAPG
jgi:hypothetical protein